MNEITLLNEYIINHFENEDLVNTISIVPTMEIDINIENIYPLVNIDMTQSDIQEELITVSFIITAVQQRDTKPKELDNKLLNDSNYLDNMNETHSVIEKFMNVLLRQNNDSNIDIVSQSKVRFLKKWSRSSLDGCQITIDLSIPNIGSSC